MMDVFIYKIENHQALTAIIIFSLTIFFSILGYFIKKIITKKNSSPYIKIGGKNLKVGGSIFIGDINHED